MPYACMKRTHTHTHTHTRTHTHRYTKAAEAGVAEAQFVLGWRYATGQGCQRNDELALNLYRKVSLPSTFVAR